MCIMSPQPYHTPKLPPPTMKKPPPSPPPPGTCLPPFPPPPRYGLPTLGTAMGRGLIPDTHPLAVHAARALALQQADVAVIVGARWGEGDAGGGLLWG